MRQLPLSRGKFALVDDEDFDRLSLHKWSAFTQGTDWYAVRHVQTNGIRKSIYMHRVIMGAPTGVLVDHINHDGLDNRKVNLRLATQSQNQTNSKRITRNKTGYRGVYFHVRHGKWYGRINADGKHIHLGSFTDPAEAARQYDKAAKELFGEFARVNFP